LSSGIGAKSLLAAKMDNIFASIVCSLAVCIISFVGFANLVSYVYPIIGLAMIIYAIVQTWPQPQGKKR
jgi:uncharacterized membrane protein YkvI